MKEHRATRCSLAGTRCDVTGERLWGALLMYLVSDLT